VDWVLLLLLDCGREVVDSGKEVDSGV